MAMAGDRYKTMIMRKTWNVAIMRKTQNVATQYVATDEEYLIAMKIKFAAELAELTAMNTEFAKIKKRFAAIGDGQIQKPTNDDDPKLKLPEAAPNPAVKPAEPSTKARQYARALMNVMDFEDDNEFEDEDL
jgi:hypothetical protein